MLLRAFSRTASALFALLLGAPAFAASADFDFTISYSGQYISGRLVGLNLDASGNGNEVDPTSVLIYHAPASVGLSATQSNPYVLVPSTFGRAPYNSGTAYTATTPGVYGFHVTNFTITPSQQNLLLQEAGGDVTLLFNYGGGLCGECGTPTYGIMAEEDALWPSINTGVSFTYVAPPPCPGDLNGDRSVDLSDLALELSAYGCTTGNCPGDLNADGRTDLSDLAVLLSDYGSTCQ